MRRTLALLAALALGLIAPLDAQQTWGRWEPSSAAFGDWRWGGPVADEAALPAGAAPGTCRWAIAEEALYCWTGAAWIPAGGGVDTDDQTAAEVPYSPAVGADWGTDPNDAAEAFDQLAERLTDEEAELDDDVPEASDFGALNPSACSSDQWVIDITAGALVCAQPSFASLSGSAVDDQIPNTITVNLAAAATALAADPANCSAGEWAAGVAASGTAQGCTPDDDSPDSDAEVPDSITAGQLAANGANCAAGSWAAGVDASGAAEGCTADDDSPDNDAEVPDSITASNYAPLAGAAFTGAVSIDDAQAFKLFEADAQGSHSFTLTAPASLTGDTTCTIAADGRIPDSCVGDGTDDGGAGDVVGPASATDECFARFDSTTGRLIQNSGVCANDSNQLQVDNDGAAATPSIVDADNLDTGIRFGAGTADEVIISTSNDFTSWVFSTVGMRFKGNLNANDTNGPTIANAQGSPTSPNVRPNGPDTDSGLGYLSSNGNDMRGVAGGQTRLGWSGATNGESVTHQNGNFTADGDGRYRSLTSRNSTTNATPAELFLNGSSTRMVLANDSTWTFSCVVTGRRTDADGEGAGYKLEGVIDRQTNAASTALIGSVTQTVLAEDNAAWDATATADTTNGALILTVTGEASKTIRWVGSCSTVEVTG